MESDIQLNLSLKWPTVFEAISRANSQGACVRVFKAAARWPSTEMFCKLNCVTERPTASFMSHAEYIDRHLGVGAQDRDVHHPRY